MVGSFAAQRALPFCGVRHFDCGAALPGGLVAFGCLSVCFTVLGYVYIDSCMCGYMDLDMDVVSGSWLSWCFISLQFTLGCLYGMAVRFVEFTPWCVVMWFSIRNWNSSYAHDLKVLNHSRLIQQLLIELPELGGVSKHS